MQTQPPPVTSWGLKFWDGYSTVGPKCHLRARPFPHFSKLIAQTPVEGLGSFLKGCRQLLTWRFVTSGIYRASSLCQAVTCKGELARVPVPRILCPLEAGREANNCTEGGEAQGSGGQTGPEEVDLGG